ncbi:MAG: glycosyltransferase family 2 protein [Candidatus Dormibacteraeota bacterium]|nr:glycosyltransferase family 2 protein [Candidatus Dormibacteraeota bacterium]
MVTGKPLVTAIVIGRNQRDQVLACLGSYLADADTPRDAVVVDATSGDGTPEAVAAHYPAVKVVRRLAASGYGRSGNAGLSVAEGRFILLLDPAVAVQPGCVGRLADFLLTRPDAGAVGPRLDDRRADGVERPDPAARRGFPTPSSRLYRALALDRMLPHSRRFNGHGIGHLRATETHEIDAGSGACLLVRRSAIDRVGFFDPDYSRFGEDLDLCYRLKMGGWKVFYVPDARAVRMPAQVPLEVRRRSLWDEHTSMWTFHHKHYAADLPAFANGLVWATNWAGWGYRAAREELQGATPNLSPPSPPTRRPAPPAPGEA